MIHEAQVFLLADQAAMEVFGCVREEHWGSELPPVFDMPGADLPTPLRRVLAHIAYDEAWIPDMLAGWTMNEVGRDRFDGDLLGGDPHGNLQRLAALACAAASQVTDGNTIVHCSFGDVPVRDYFWQLTIAQPHRPRCSSSPRARRPTLGGTVTGHVGGHGTVSADVALLRDLPGARPDAGARALAGTVPGADRSPSQRLPVLAISG